MVLGVGGVGGGLTSRVLDILQYTHDMVLGVGGGLTSRVLDALRDCTVVYYTVVPS